MDTEEKTKIYLFNNSRGDTDWNVVYAIAETGEVLAQHCCSHICFMRGDLYENRPERKKSWAEKYPNGYEIIELRQGETPPQEVIERNQELQKQSIA